MKTLINVPISKLTSFKNAGNIKKLIIFEKISEIINFLQKNQDPFYILGAGSNLLINPKTKIKTFIKMKLKKPYLLKDHTLLRINAGITSTKLLSICTKNQLGGLEFTAGVPATIGGMVYMNFGCWQQNIGDFVEQVFAIDKKGLGHWLNKNDLAFNYRTSLFQKNQWLIVEVIFKLKKDTIENIQTKIKANIQKRLESQPLKSHTFGSIFKNPTELKGQSPFKTPSSAGQILDYCEFKGYKFNDHLKISEKHANFMVNLNQATFNDTIKLIKLIQTSVKKQTGLDLKTEVKLVK